MGRSNENPNSKRRCDANFTVMYENAKENAMEIPNNTSKAYIIGEIEDGMVIPVGDFEGEKGEVDAVGRITKSNIRFLSKEEIEERKQRKILAEQDKKVEKFARKIDKKAVGSEKGEAR